MRTNPMTSALSAGCATLLLVACNEATTSPSKGREANREANTALAASTHEAHAATDVPLPQPFLIRAPIDAFFINQAPEFMIRSRSRTDLVMQRIVAQPGAGAWHTHPGPSFGIVEQGRVMITRYNKGVCTKEVYGPGEPNGAAYFEVADEVHRATVLGPAVAVEYKARFNTPVGAPFSTPASAPGC